MSQLSLFTVFLQALDNGRVDSGSQHKLLVPSHIASVLQTRIGCQVSRFEIVYPVLAEYQLAVLSSSYNNIYPDASTQQSEPWR